MSGHTQPGQLDEAVRVVREVFLPEFQKQKGFLGLLFLVDTSTNKCLSISFWESEADMKGQDRKSTRLNSSHVSISYAVFCLKKKNKILLSPVKGHDYINLVECRTF